MTDVPTRHVVLARYERLIMTVFFLTLAAAAATCVYFVFAHAPA